MQYEMFHSLMSYTQPWVSFTTTQELHKYLITWMEHHYWVYDADTCGDRTVHFVIRQDQTETYWRVCQTWWIEYEPDWEMRNEFEITRMDQAQFEYPKVARDCLRLLKTTI